jgi:hypothetical protein
MTKRYQRGNQNLFFDLQILVTPFVSCGHCVVCPLIYRFWLPLWYLLVIVFVVCPSLIYRLGQTTQWPKDSKGVTRICQSKKDRQHNGSFFDLQIMVAPLVSFGHCVVCPSLQILVTPLVSFGHCVVCPSLQILVTPLVSIGHCVVCPLHILITPLVIPKG